MKTIKEKSYSVHTVIPSKKEQKELDKIISEVKSEKLDSKKIKKLKRPQ